MRSRVFEYVKYACDFYQLRRRMSRRGKTWASGYKRYLAGLQPDPPFPQIVQIIPTEQCILRCKMCNQWGDTGYFVTGKRPVSSMAVADLIRFLNRYRQIEPDFLLSVHGGEPFMYHHMPELLDYLAEHRIDTYFSINGTLLARHAEKLARMNRHAMYLRSIDGGEETNDLIRGKGTTRKIIEGIHLLRDHSLGMRNGFPKIVVNYCVNEHNPGDIDRVTPIAREVVRSS